MAVNFFGALHCTHAALDELVARRGMVIAISSVAGFAPLIARTGYAASKHALHGFFDSLRTEVEPLGVKVLLVCPSFIETGIEKNALDGHGGPARHAQSIVGVRATPGVHRRQDLPCRAQRAPPAAARPGVARVVVGVATGAQPLRAADGGQAEQGNAARPLKSAARRLPGQRLTNFNVMRSLSPMAA